MLSPHIIFADLSSDSAATPSCGLDPSVLSSLPTFPFSFPPPLPTTITPDGLDCILCLSDFRPSVNVRLLSKCDHPMVKNHHSMLSSLLFIRFDLYCHAVMHESTDLHSSYS
ncbi:hypothetical protein Syun_015457 [Stephania yunnanensis]|uniref:Uncharacterized protein n=1 Tax=Stephania yunnanensis TaxID=152371 RepID=A0AAP0JNJ9_9MAGN